LFEQRKDFVFAVYTAWYWPNWKGCHFLGPAGM